MLLRHGKARNSRIDRRLACTLAAVAGAVNVAAYQSVGFFAANMTGNVSAASIQTATGQIATAGFYLLIVVTFIAGAAVSSMLVNFGRRRGIAGIYALSILAEAVFMALLGLIDPLLFQEWQGSALILGLSFLMGLQNAVVTRISDARVRTTHISGMATDIGIGLGMLLDIGRGREQDADRTFVLARLRLHAMTVLSFFGGGLVGAFVYRMAANAMLLGCAGVLLALALPAAIRARELKP